MRTGNPALSENAFDREAGLSNDSSVMTIGGAIQKTAILTVLLVAAGAVSWTLVNDGGTALESPVKSFRLLFGLGAPLLGFAVALLISFVPKTAPFASPVYAVLQGLFLGAISSWMNAAYAGIAIEAALLTVGTLAVMLFLYASRWIVVTNKLRTGIIAATGAVCLMYLATFLLRLFGVNFPFLSGSGPVSIGISMLVVAVAAFNLVLDFDTIERGARARAPKYMEWYSAFGLLVTLVWLYLEILRLLAKLRGRD